jgi:hypothetical protein
MTRRRKVCGRFDDLPKTAKLSIRSLCVATGQGIEEWVALDADTLTPPMIVALPRDVFLDAIHHAYHDELEEGDDGV